MTRAAFAIPGDLSTLTGGYGYDRRLLAALPAHGIDVAHARLPEGFPFPDDAAVETALDMLRHAATDVLLIDGLAGGVLPASALAALPSPFVALVHHPLGMESGLDAATSRKLLVSERAALGVAAHVIVTSATTAQTLASDLGVTPAHITVAEPGTDAAARAVGSQSNIPTLLAIGAVVPRKGYDILIEALARLAHLNWRLRIVGNLERSPATVTALRQSIRRHALAGRIELAGSLDDDALALAYGRADVFVLASHYEGYGMVLTEAMARGLPMVTTTGGAAAQTVPDVAALKVPPGDVEALRAALVRLITDRALRFQLANDAWAAGQDLPRWADTAAIVANVIHRVAERT